MGGAEGRMRVDKRKAPRAGRHDGGFVQRHNRIVSQRNWERSCAGIGLAYFLAMLFIFLNEIGVW